MGEQERHRLVRSKDVSKACFVLCCVCHDDKRGWDSYHKTAAEEDIDMTTPVDPSRITSSCDDADWTLIDGYQYILVYMDGSAVHTTDRLSARASWRVWYCEQSPFNGIEKLVGPVETLYKAEGRALLHVGPAGVPTYFMCDCLSVVNTFNQILDNPCVEVERCADGELCEVIRTLLKEAPTNFFRFQWTPSHLDDPKHKNSSKRKQYIDDGPRTGGAKCQDHRGNAT